MTLRRQVAGSLLWAVQVYFEISHEVTLMGASIKEAVATVEGEKSFFNRYNRVVKTLKAAKSIIWYHSLDKLSKNSSVEITRSLTLVGFSDAGFGSLSDGRSTKSCVVILSSAVKTVEEISCSGWLVYSSAGKMSRVARSSLAAEVVALSECVDFL